MTVVSTSRARCKMTVDLYRCMVHTMSTAECRTRRARKLLMAYGGDEKKIALHVYSNRCESLDMSRRDATKEKSTEHGRLAKTDVAMHLRLQTNDIAQAVDDSKVSAMASTTVDSNFMQIIQRGSTTKVWGRSFKSRKGLTPPNVKRWKHNKQGINSPSSTSSRNARMLPDAIGGC